jgi:uncharacterized protein YbaR (Trm112 family)
MSVDPELLEILACPACDERPPVTLCRLKEDVAKTLVEKYRERMRDEEPVVTEGLSCGKCGRVYAIVSDIPIMLVEDALPAEARLS